jgi:hypothetical protein
MPIAPSAVSTIISSRRQRTVATNSARKPGSTTRPAPNGHNGPKNSRPNGNVAMPEATTALAAASAGRLLVTRTTATIDSEKIPAYRPPYTFTSSLTGKWVNCRTVAPST